MIVWAVAVRSLDDAIQYRKGMGTETTHWRVGTRGFAGAPLPGLPLQGKEQGSGTRRAYPIRFHVLPLKKSAKSPNDSIICALTKSPNALIDALRIVRGHARDLVLPSTDSEEHTFLARRMGCWENHDTQEQLAAERTCLSRRR
jgi:hypothetical protein